MFRFLRVFSHRKSILLVLVCLLVVGVSLSSGVIRAIDTTSPAACAVTPSLLGGQGFRVSGQGFRVSGQGFRVSGQGFSVSGQGFRLSGQGVNLDPLVVAKEIQDNPVTPGKWVSDRLDFFTKRLGFNTDSAAVIIIDEFKPTATGEQPHGEIVKKVVDDSIAALKTTYPSLKIASFALDISDTNTNYNADIIASKISAKVTELQGAGYHHFVLNMSFGLISCTDPGTSTTPAFNFNDAAKVVAANNQASPTLAITPLLNCVVKVQSSDDDHYSIGRSRVTNKAHDGDSSYIAYFGYKNENDQLVKIDIGANNSFAPSPSNRSQPNRFEPGKQNFAFSIKFNGSNLTWTLKGPDGQTRSVTANKYSTPCSPVPPKATQPVTPVVECVSDEGGGVFKAHFGYTNPNTVGVTIPVGYKNQFAPAPADRGQVTTFISGDHDDVFVVAFDGINLKWTLGSVTVTANSSTKACPEQQGFGISQYLTQNLGVPEDQLDEYWSHLANPVSTDEFQNLRQLLRQYLSDSADPSENFTAVTVASSGNLRPWLGDAPLAPASWQETIAVGATLDDGTNLWQFSQDANVVAPGVGYPLGDNSFAAGTSFAAPAFSVLVGMCSTVPRVLHFDGTNPPLANNHALGNAFIGTANLTPLLCAPNRKPTITPISDRNDKEGTAISLQVVASDPDGDTLKYSAPALPPGLSIDINTGLISGTIADDSAGTYPVTVTVTDNGTPQGSASTSFNWVVIPAQITVKIDIRPHSSKNRINLNSWGLVAVAVFGSSTFDATSIDPSTVTLAGAPAVKLFNKFYTRTYDVNHDGKQDRILWFRAKQLQLTSSSTEAVLLGKTISGTDFRGVDKVTIVPPKAPRLVSPTSGKTINNSVVKLTWSDEQDWEEGDNECYTVQVSKTSGFTSVVDGAIVVDRESYTTNTLPSGTYYWRVAFSDCSANPVSAWSDVWKFKVQP